MAKMTKPLTKSQLVANIAEDCDVTKKQVAAMLDSLAANIAKSLGKSGAGKFVLPGLLKIEKKNYAIASRIIRDTIDAGLLRQAAGSRKDARYAPFWA